MNNKYKIFIIFILLGLISSFPEKGITIGINQVFENILFAIIFNANDEYYNIIAPNNHFVLNKRNNSIKLSSITGIYFGPETFLFNQENEYYILLGGNVLYHIKFNNYSEIIGLSNEGNKFIHDLSNYQYFNYFSQKNIIILSRKIILMILSRMKLFFMENNLIILYFIIILKDPAKFLLSMIQKMILFLIFCLVKCLKKINLYVYLIILILILILPKF